MSTQKSKIIRHQNLPASGPQREALRETGQFWTPDWVAEAMVTYILRGGCKVLLDPAVGEGAFVRAAIKVGEELNHPFDIHGYEKDRDLIERTEILRNHAQVKPVDFLQEIWGIKYSGIVCNPPYIRHHRLSADTKLTLRKMGESLLGAPLDGRAGIHIYFLIAALHRLEENGRLAFILPADICEGVFSSQLWAWITANYFLEAVVTFAPEATPFPNVDVNPVVFFIKRTKQREDMWWVRCKEAWASDLKLFVLSNFEDAGQSLEVHRRILAEALTTGLSRPPHTNTNDFIPLSSFVKVMRGIATGANEYFLMTSERASALEIPTEFLVRIIARSRDVKEDLITTQLLENLNAEGKASFIFSPDNRQTNQFPLAVQRYLQMGVDLGLPERPLIKQRKPWYKMEVRNVPPFLFAYLGRRNARFIRNLTDVRPLTGFLCVYPKETTPNFIDRLWNILRHEETVNNLALVGKSYGSGAIKVEPRALENLPIPVELIERVGLQLQTHQT